MLNWIKINLERYFLFMIALGFLFFSIQFLRNSEVTGATASFVMFFLCLIYSNVSRFKKFKGLGIEAELWEDKQKEAADLIDRLKNIVNVYTREIVMMKVMSGRFSGGSRWPACWALYDELVDQHDTLGQRIDFLPLKEKIYRIMVFDAASYIHSLIRESLVQAHAKARELINVEFGNPIKDVAGFNQRLNDLNSLRVDMQDMFEISQSDNIARLLLKDIEEAVEGFREKFGIEVEIPADKVAKLQRIDALFQVGDLRVDEELMKWADRER